MTTYPKYDKTFNYISQLPMRCHCTMLEEYIHITIKSPIPRLCPRLKNEYLHTISRITNLLILLSWFWHPLRPQTWWNATTELVLVSIIYACRILHVPWTYVCAHLMKFSLTIPNIADQNYILETVLVRSSFMFQYSAKGCVPYFAVCDGYPHCEHSSDGFCPEERGPKLSQQNSKSLR